MASIHLIYPDVSTGYYPNIHHGLAWIVGMLKSEGHQVTLHHITTEESPDEVAAQALRGRPDLIGFSLCTNQMQFAEEYVKAIRKRGTNALLIAGGIHPTSDPPGTFERLEIDGLAIGESEQTLAALMKAVDANDREAIVKTGGFHFRGPDGKIIENPTPPIDPDLADLPLPDYSLFNVRKIVKDSAGWMNMILSRGCPYDCHYCCNAILMRLYPVKKDYFRVPSVEYAMKVIRSNLESGGDVKGIVFDDDLLCLNKAWFRDFAEAYKREIGLPYTMLARVETMHDDTIENMRLSGCKIVSVGVESGNSWVRETLLNRRYSDQKLIDMCRKLRKAKVRLSTFNIVGFPFETPEMMKQTLTLNKKLKPYSGGVFYFYPYPKTQLFTVCKDFKLFRKDSFKLKGYFAKPSIKLTHATDEDAIRICDRLRLYLYLRRILTNLKLGFTADVVYYAMLPLAHTISVLLSGDSKLKWLIRKFVYATTSFTSSVKSRGRIRLRPVFRNTEG